VREGRDAVGYRLSAVGLFVTAHGPQRIAHSSPRHPPPLALTAALLFLSAPACAPTALDVVPGCYEATLGPWPDVRAVAGAPPWIRLGDAREPLSPDPRSFRVELPATTPALDSVQTAFWLPTVPDSIALVWSEPRGSVALRLGVRKGTLIGRAFAGGSVAERYGRATWEVVAKRVECNRGPGAGGQGPGTAR
jgi:hypothetical protein